MELICSNCVYISSPSSLLSPVIRYSKTQQNSVKLNRKYSSKNRTRRPVVIRAQKSDSLVQVDKLLSTSSNSALEQLDIERGVCVPFRKYTPESVCNYFSYVTVDFPFAFVELFILVSNELEEVANHSISNL